MRALEFIRGHVIFKLRYNQIYQLKTTLVLIWTYPFPDFRKRFQDLRYKQGFGGVEISANMVHHSKNTVIDKLGIAVKTFQKLTILPHYLNCGKSKK